MRFTPLDTNEAGLHVRAHLQFAVARGSPLAKREGGFLQAYFLEEHGFFTFFW